MERATGVLGKRLKVGDRIGCRTLVRRGKPRAPGNIARWWALCDCGVEALHVPSNLYRPKGCKHCSRSGGNNKGKTWTVTCRRCSGKGHMAKTCSIPREQAVVL